MKAMKAKIVCLVLGLFLSTLAVRAAVEDRFKGGSYDGWDRCGMTNALGLLAAEENRFKGGSYDGWERCGMTNALAVLAAEENRFKGGSYDGWDRQVSTGYTYLWMAVGSVYTIR